MFRGNMFREYYPKLMLCKYQIFRILMNNIVNCDLLEFFKNFAFIKR